MLSETGYMTALAVADTVKERVGHYEDHIAALEAQVRTLTLALAVESSNVFGLTKELDAWKGQHPDSILDKPDGRFAWRDGSPKTVGRAIFELAFDTKAKELGIANPAEHRKG